MNNNNAETNRGKLRTFINVGTDVIYSVLALRNTWSEVRKKRFERDLRAAIETCGSNTDTIGIPFPTMRVP